MKRPRKDAAALLEKLLADKQELQDQIDNARKLVESKRKAADLRRQRILAEACLTYFADPLAAKNARAIETLLKGKMKPADMEWYLANPHQLIAEGSPPTAAPVTAEARKPSSDGEASGGNTASEQSTQDQA